MTVGQALGHTTLDLPAMGIREMGDVRFGKDTRPPGRDQDVPQNGHQQKRGQGGGSRPATGPDDPCKGRNAGGGRPGQMARPGAADPNARGQGDDDRDQWTMINGWAACSGSRRDDGSLCHVPFPAGRASSTGKSARISERGPTPSAGLHAACRGGPPDPAAAPPAERTAAATAAAVGLRPSWCSELIRLHARSKRRVGAVSLRCAHSPGLCGRRG